VATLATTTNLQSSMQSWALRHRKSLSTAGSSSRSASPRTQTTAGAFTWRNPSGYAASKCCWRVPVSWYSSWTCVVLRCCCRARTRRSKRVTSMPRANCCRWCKSSPTRTTAQFVASASCSKRTGSTPAIDLPTSATTIFVSRARSMTRSVSSWCTKQSRPASSPKDLVPHRHSFSFWIACGSSPNNIHKGLWPSPIVPCRSCTDLCESLAIVASISMARFWCTWPKMPTRACGVQCCAIHTRNAPKPMLLKIHCRSGPTLLSMQPGFRYVFAHNPCARSVVIG
jgi:hypothetical protein